jgi:hypothetical protein
MRTEAGRRTAACAARCRWTLRGLAESIRIEDGWFTPPDRPGHGILDRDTLAAHAVDARALLRLAAISCTRFGGALS